VLLSEPFCASTYSKLFGFQSRSLAARAASGHGQSRKKKNREIFRIVHKRLRRFIDRAHIFRVWPISCHQRQWLGVIDPELASQIARWCTSTSGALLDVNKQTKTGNTKGKIVYTNIVKFTKKLNPCYSQAPPWLGEISVSHPTVEACWQPVLPFFRVAAIPSSQVRWLLVIAYTIYFRTRVYNPAHL